MPYIKYFLKIIAMAIDKIHELVYHCRVAL